MGDDCFVASGDIGNGDFGLCLTGAAASSTASGLRTSIGVLVDRGSETRLTRLLLAVLSLSSL